MTIFESLRDNAEETFIKLGYSDIEMSYNYPESTVRELLADGADNELPLEERLASALFSHELFCDSRIRKRKGGVSVTLTRECVRELYRDFDPDGFLPELYRVIGRHGVSESDIRSVFLRHRPNSEILPSSDKDFDLLVLDRSGVDPYRYLFKLDHGHCDFHRLLPSDFEEIYKKDN